VSGPVPYRWDFQPVRLLYSGVYGSAALAYHVINTLRGRTSAAAFQERLGKTTFPGKTAPLWLHASSMGEIRVAAGLAEELLQRSPHTPLVCTASTETGYRLGRQLLEAKALVVRAPIDTPGAVYAFLSRVKPQALVLIETEWWPNQLVACFDRGIPVFVANGRVSARSVKRYRLVRRHLLPLLSRIERWFMKGEADAARMIDLGVARSRVEVAGSLKNIAPPGKLVERTALPPGPPVFLAGCTRPGEEEIVLAAFQAAREQIPDLRLWLAPRHPERFAEVAALLRNLGQPWAAYSVLPQNKLDADDSPGIVLIDKMGVLAELYARAAIAFVGGSLLPFGGHNPVEPVLAGAPTLFGPFTDDQADAAEALLAASLGHRVNDSATLAAGIMRAFKDPPPFADWNRRRREFFSTFAEAAGHVAAEILRGLKRP
jgi:3-deoxy-D-manno-octulosonic-acid transferase